MTWTLIIVMVIFGINAAAMTSVSGYRTKVECETAAATAKRGEQFITNAYCVPGGSAESKP